ncbi:hypothetical protein JCM14469_14470 [Desulfatiferula olefinivorans]
MNTQRQRFTIILPALLLLIAVLGATPAQAFFEEGHLILSVYNENDMDLGVDLGVALELSQSTATNVVLAPPGTVSLDKFGDNVDGWDDLRAAAWGRVMDTPTNTYQMYMAMTETMSPVPSSNLVMNFFSLTADVSLTGYGDTNNGQQFAVISSTDRNSYDQKLNRASNAPGTFGALHPAGSHLSEADLGTLITSGYTDLNVYSYDLFNNQAGLAGGNPPNAKIRIMADGSVILNPSSANTITITSASADISDTDEGSAAPITFAGAATDTSGSQLVYAWAEASGRATAWISHPADSPAWTLRVPDVTEDTVYTFHLTVSDHDGNQAVSDPVTVTVRNVNRAPEAAAGDDITLNRATAGDTVTIQGSASDRDGDAITIAWTQTAGTPVALSGADTATPSFSLAQVDPSDSILGFQITVTDAHGAQDQAGMTVTLFSPPTALAQATPLAVDEVHGATAQVALVGSGSSDPDNDIVSFTWTVADSLPGVTFTHSDTGNPDRTALIPEVSADTALTFTLTVTDTRGNTDSDSITVTVRNVNQAPAIASLTCLPDTVHENAAFTLSVAVDDDAFTADETHVVWTFAGDDTPLADEDGDPLTLTVTAPDLSAADAPFRRVTYRVTVIDEAGDEVTGTKDVDVHFVNQPPEARISCPGCADGWTENIESGLSVSLTGAGSSDPDSTPLHDDIETYHWILRDATGQSLDEASSGIPEYSLLAPQSAGEYTLTLTVTDRAGETSRTSLTLSVVNTAGPNPVITAGSRVYERQTLSLSGDQSTDADGEGMESIMTWSWSCVPDIGGVFSDTAALSPTFTAPSVDADTPVTIVLTLTGTNGIQAGRSHALTIADNRLPTPPSINHPRHDPLAGTFSPGNGEVSSLFPTVSVNPATDADGHSLTYRFQLAADAAMTRILAERSGLVREGTTVRWALSAQDFIVQRGSLADHTVYYFRASADDGISLPDERLWSETAAFFVNTDNDAPELPELSAAYSPRLDAVIRTITPSFALPPAQDADRDVLSYEFEIRTTMGHLFLPSFPEDIVPAENRVTWTPDWTGLALELDDNTVYLWRVRSLDDEGLGSGWQDIPFTVNIADESPLPPAIRTPARGSEVLTRTPTLTVVNAVDHDPGDTASYYFEITARGDAEGCEERFTLCDDLGGCTLFESGAVNEGSVDPELPDDGIWSGLDDGEGLQDDGWDFPVSDGTTSFTVPLHQPGLPLADNSPYCWRVQARDEGGLAGPWTYGDFFVNLENDPPQAPEILAPEHQGRVTVARPTLNVSPATDPDRDMLSYEFELYEHASEGAPLHTATTDQCHWTLPEAVRPGVTYAWRVRALDQDSQGPWTTWAEFRYFPIYPPAPLISSPANGNAVNTLSPTLSVLNPDGVEGDDLDYVFELYADSRLSSWVARARIPQGETVTTWSLDSDSTLWNDDVYDNHLLIDGSAYYWRVGTCNGSNDVEDGAWMTTARFVVRLDAKVLDVKVESAAPVSANAQGDQYVTVSDPESPVYGVSLRIPPNAVDEDRTITIGFVTNSVSLPSKVVSLSRVIGLSPPGLSFGRSVELTLPWNVEGLPAGVVENAETVVLYLYDPENGTWETVQEVPITSVKGSTITFTLNHFSHYAVGIPIKGSESSDDDPDPAAGSDDDDDPGCFIGVLRR